MFNFSKGLLKPDLVKNLKSLACNEEEKFVLSWLYKITFRLRIFQVIVFVLFAVYSFVSILVFVLAEKIEQFSSQQTWILFFIYTFIAISAYLIDVLGAGRLMNTYTRIVSTVFDNILQSTYDTYTVSLAHLITKYPSPKTFSIRLSSGALSANNYKNSSAQIVGIGAGMLFAVIYGFATKDIASLVMAIFGTILIGLFVFFMFLGKRYVVSEENLSKYSDHVDRMYNDRKSLLFSNQNLINIQEFKDKISVSVLSTTYINLTTNFVKLIIPVILVLSPFVFEQNNDLFILVAACLFITMKVFSQTTAASNYNSMTISDTKVRQLENLYETIKKVGAELTPEKYQQKRLEFKNGSTNSKSATMPKGVSVRNLSFVVGRGEEKRWVTLEKLELGPGKVHFLYGKSGAGKSIFGRILALRYADYEAGTIALDGKDIREHQTLEEGLAELHFSSLRHVTTSYRNAISIYISDKLNFKGFLDYVFSLRVSAKSLHNYFAKHTRYYSGLNVSIFNEDETKGKITGISETELMKVADIIRDSDWDSVDSGILDVVTLLEYCSFNYLKIFIPDATLYFMDAILSEPPISQGQRRRVILALDLMVKGKVFVADEPFANLDDKSGENVLELLDKYAKRNNAVVLVLDQKKRISGLSDLQTGKVMEINNDRVLVRKN